MKPIIAFFLCLAAWTPPPALAQQDFVLPWRRSERTMITESAAATAATERFHLATAHPAYPVTPGDVYRIAFQLGSDFVVNEVTVDSDYTLNLNRFGVLDVANTSYRQLKTQVQQLIERAYPRSFPSFSLVSVGIFRIVVRGEIAQTSEVTVWGLSRLSEVVEPLLAPYSSIRRVRVAARDTAVREYDLFKAISLGDIEQDPYVKPGDLVSILPIERVIQVRGEINQPGDFELRAEETAVDLLRFARGFTSNADSERILITSTAPVISATRTVDARALDASFPLAHGDRINVPSRQEREPTVYVEGAVAREAGVTGAPSRAQEYNRIARPLSQGQSLFELLTRIRADLSPSADMAGARIIRQDGEELPVDIGRLLFGNAFELDVVLRPFDRIIIPYRQSFVLVVGAVNAPGSFPLVPGQDALYYIRAAGGFNSELNKDDRFMVRGANGRAKTPVEPIEAGDVIEAARNDFVYNFNRYFPIITAGLGFITTLVSILTVISQ